MDSARYPIPHPQVAARVVDGAAVIVLADAGQVNVLNPLGSRIWELIDGTRNIQAIAETICEEYEVSLHQALADVEEFVEKLVDANALVLEERPVRPV
jgi:hypothetical protein